MGVIFKAMADPTRQRLLVVLSRQELSVSELVEVLGLPQSTVSRHLKVLRDAGLLLDRRVGAAVLHAAPPLAQPGGPAAVLAAPGFPHASASVSSDRPGDAANGRSAAEFRQTLLEWAGHEPLDERTHERIEQAVRHRRETSHDFFERVGSRWDQLRIEAFGESFHLEALTALLPASWKVADIGSGTGYLLPVLAGRFERVIAVDPAGAMLEAARGRPELRDARNVEFREGSAEQLPLQAGEIDLVIASLVLHHVAEPAVALCEFRRVLRQGGRLLIIEQCEHGGDEFHERMGDYWRGFARPALQAWVEKAGFKDVRISSLTSAKPAGRQTGEIPGLYALTSESV